MAEQKQRLKQDAENERVLLLKTHEQQRKEFEHRTTKAETEMKRIRQTLKAQYESVSAPSAIGQEDSTAICKTLDRFRKPRRTVDRRTNTVSELPPTQAQALHDSQGSYKENIEPRNRIFSEPDSWPIGREIYNDTSTSSLSEVQSMSLPSQREIQANNILSQIRVGSNKSSSSWGPSQPMPNPFIDCDRPTSKSGAVANTSSRRSLNIANALSILNPTLLDRDAFPIDNPGYCADVQHQPISHSTVDEAPNSQNLTTYGHPTASRPHSDTIRDETRKRKSLSAHHDGQVCKKSRASLVPYGSHIVPEMQCPQAQADSQIAASKSSQPRNRPQSGHLVSGTRQKKGHSNSQVTTLKSSKVLDVPTSMLSQTLPGRGNSRHLNPRLAQLQSRPPLTGMSRARSSQTNRRYSGRRTKSAKAAKKSVPHRSGL